MILIDTRYLGAAIKHARRNAKLSKHGLAGYLGIPPREISKYESGKTVIPINVLNKLLRRGIANCAWE